MYASGHIILFLGPPGSGKGTQAGRLAAALGIPAISTGQMLRQECQSGSRLGKSVESIMTAGGLVGDDLMNQVVAARLLQADCAQGCILDGYPRTAAQARFLDGLLGKRRMPGPVVFDFRIDADEIVTRLSRRRHCPECGRIVNVELTAAPAELLCESDGAKLMHRADDEPQTIRQRLRLYHGHADELARHYAGKNYYPICAARTPEKITDELLAIFEAATPSIPGLQAPVLVPQSYRVQPA